MLALLAYIRRGTLNNKTITRGSRREGILITLDGKIETTYSQGLGCETNNVAKVLALQKGLHIAKKQGINELIVVRDSILIIQNLFDNVLPSYMHIRQLIRKIQNLSNSFRKIDFFHVIRKLNGKADHATNIATTLGKGVLVKNGSSTFFQVPQDQGLWSRGLTSCLPHGARC